MKSPLVPAEGFEPPTFGLQNRCTTTVLSRRGGVCLEKHAFSVNAEKAWRNYRDLDLTFLCVIAIKRAGQPSLNRVGLAGARSVMELPWKLRRG